MQRSNGFSLHSSYRSLVSRGWRSALPQGASGHSGITLGRARAGVGCWDVASTESCNRRRPVKVRQAVVARFVHVPAGCHMVRFSNLPFESFPRDPRALKYRQRGVRVRMRPLGVPIQSRSFPLGLANRKCARRRALRAIEFGVDRTLHPQLRFSLGGPARRI